MLARSTTTPVRRVDVVVPARDEAETIGGSLDAIVSAARSVRPEVHITVVDDRSVDRTAEVARHRLRSAGLPYRIVDGVGQGVGAARRLGIAAATDDVADPSRCWVLSTDADTFVPPDWIDRHLRHAAGGAVAVAGVVDLIDDVTTDDFIESWRADYGATLAVDGTHPHVHAANLAIRLDVYRRAGGFAAVERADDIDLWRRVRATGVDPIADAGSIVLTSGRRRGRVAAGFAGALATLYPERVTDAVQG